MDTRDSPGIERLLAIMARLRDPQGGCPWDREQSFATIAPYTLEEAYEVLGAIQSEDAQALREELGDLLFQVVFHARMAEEAGQFAFGDVVRSICEKMIRRHPHVFARGQVDSAEAQGRAWEQHKLTERESSRTATRQPGRLDGITPALPALARAVKLQRRAAQVGFDWSEPQGILDKLQEELNELREAMDEGQGPGRVEAELGDMLFTCGNLARWLSLDPEAALRGANARFERRFRAMEANARARGQTLERLDPEALEGLWQEAKRSEPE